MNKTCQSNLEDDQRKITKINEKVNRIGIYETFILYIRKDEVTGI